MELPCDLAIPFLGIYARELKAEIQADTCISTSTVPQLKYQNNLRDHQQMNRLKKKVVHRYNRIVFIHRKKLSSDTCYYIDETLKIFCDYTM